jgi:hypothetical protein
MSIRWKARVEINLTEVPRNPPEPEAQGRRLTPEPSVATRWKRQTADVRLKRDQVWFDEVVVSAAEFMPQSGDAKEREALSRTSADGSPRCKRSPPDSAVPELPGGGRMRSAAWMWRLGRQC